MSKFTPIWMFQIESLQYIVLQCFYILATFYDTCIITCVFPIHIVYTYCVLCLIFVYYIFHNSQTNRPKSHWIQFDAGGDF